MKYRQVKKLPSEEFRRLTGVKPDSFQAMFKVLQGIEKEKRKRGGSPPDVSLADMLLMTLEYWREYRTYFHIGQSYGVSEATAFRYIRWVEDTLIKSGKFTLPGRKALLKSDMVFEVVMIDATESPVERPKKSSGDIIPARKNATR